MSINIPDALKMLANAANSIATFAKVRQEMEGKGRTLIEELETNSFHCWSVIERGVPVGDIVNALSTTKYDELNQEGFDFNIIKSRKVYRYRSLAGTDLAFLGGKETKVLITNIYDRIKDLKAKYPYAENSNQKRWYMRVVNIQKRILLLLRHVKSNKK